MDRNRETRRVSMAASNGLSRRRHRSNSLRDSPEDDVVMETQETARLRDRKKERDRDRERERDRDRERERERERERDRMSSRSSKRRRGGERLIHGSSNREDGVGVGDDSSEESVNDDEDEDEDDAGVGASAAGLAASTMRMLPPNHHHHHHHNNTSTLSSSSLSNHHHNNNNTNSNHHHRKSLPPPAKIFRAAPGTAASSAAPWKAPDEMIGVSVPRKARSASTKRSHDCWASSGVGEQIHRQASTSPVRSSGPSGAAMMASASASPAPVSPPSSSTISVKKKMPNGPKQRPPKSLSSSSKPASSTQDEIEIEIAEVLYGLLRQPQASSKQEMVGTDSMKMDSREMNSNKPTGDAKSRVSSPISNSPSTAVPQSSSVPLTNSSSSTTPSMSAIAPKRKRPRPVKYEDENPSSVLPGRNSVVSSMTKVVENDQSTKIESSLDKNPGSAAENGSVGFDLLANQAVPPSTESQTEPVKQENNSVSDAKPLAEASQSRDLGVTAKEEPRSPSKESNAGLRPGEDRESLTVSKANAKVSEFEAHREEKFQIDLMAPPPPPPLRSSPERDSEIDLGSVDPKPMVTDVETELKPVVKEDDKAVKIAKEDMNVEPEEKKAKVMAEVADSHKPNKERNIDLQLDLEKTDRESGSVSSSGNKQHHVQNQKQHQQPHSEKNAQPGSLPLPMSMASWPGGLPPMGYMAPIQGVVPMDGSTVPSAAIQPPHLLFGQPRPKRCATHCYIARNIHYHQQFTRMNPFWPAAPGSALQFGAKACNVNVVPSPELHPGRGVNSVQDKGQSLAVFPPHSGKDKSSQPSNIVDTAQRKQILLQQALPPGAPNNILHGPAFIFPLSQQPGAAGASVRPGTIKSPPAASSASASSTTSSASISATAAAVAGATAMSFNYPNMPGNETQYLAILQNGAYPIPIPAHVGTNPAYRGAHMPFFNGSFYSSQMLHPSALPQQQPPSQSPQSQQGHQNPSISSGSSSSQKHLQNQQPRPHASGINGSGGNLQGFPGQKNLPSQSMQLQSRQQNLNHNVALQTRQLESEVGGEESPSTADSRVSRANMSIYGQNFGLPMHPPPNFTLMTPASVTAANSTSNNPGDKKQPQQPQSHGSKAGVEPFQSQAFAMSFAFNGAAATPGLDISSIAQNHTLLQSLPEAARHGYYMPTAAAVNPAAQQKKNFRSSEEGKAGGNDGSNVEEERKAMAGGKATMTSGQSIAFSRPDLTDTPGSTMPGNVVIDTSARPLNLGSTSGRAAGSVMSAAMSTVAASGVQQQIQRNQQQQQQMIQLHKQNQFAAAAAAASARSKAPATSNGSVYSDHISTSSMSSKFPSAISAFPQSLVQSSSSPAQSPQWKGSVRTAASQVSSPTLASTSSTLKNLPQQQIRTQQGHTQISFAANPKPSAASQGQPPPSNNQSPSPPMVVGSPTTSSISKSAGGSPRTTSTSTSNKGGQTSSLASQQAKNSQAVATQKSSPVGGRNIPSILGHPQSTISTSGSGSKPQLTQQQHLQKQAFQQAQMYTAYMQAAHAQHAASSANNTSAASGFYLQRHRSEPPQQQSQGSSTSSPTGMLSLGPPTSLANTGTTDPAKAVAAAAAAAAAVSANNMKGGSLPSLHAQFAAAQSSGKAHQLVPGFSFVHPVPSAVQVKPAEQKQPAGE